MNMTDTQLAGLLTGNEEHDIQLQAAYELGLRQGRAVDRANLQRSAKIEATKRLLAALMRAQRLDLQTAMVTLAIPRKERKTYTKIFAEKARQKQAR
ncbi:MAG: hypothetical protein IJX67_09020 [Oscillospiraceae bacterium]|nr:hypothetical protein [Oscillospiraceae bacterium]